MRTDILISFLFSTPNEIAHEVGASCNDLYFFIKQASHTLKKRNIVIEAKHNLFTSSHLNQLKYNQLNRHQPRFTKSKKIKELLSRCILTVPTMQLQYMKRIDKQTRNMSNYKKKGTDYIKIPLMVH